jgi:acetoacetyl-CoA reductase
MATTKKIALVTGGMGGLGESICIKLAALGNTVVTLHPLAHAGAWAAGCSGQ